MPHFSCSSHQKAISPWFGKARRVKNSRSGLRAKGARHWRSLHDAKNSQRQHNLRQVRSRDVV
jgi:hypothetical protein